jgi:hypothetical protein
MPEDTTTLIPSDAFAASSVKCEGLARIAPLEIITFPVPEPVVPVRTDADLREEMTQAWERDWATL